MPFIAFYRKEYVDSTEPGDKRAKCGLTLPDLWRIYDADEKVTKIFIIFPEPETKLLHFSLSSKAR